MTAKACGVMMLHGDPAGFGKLRGQATEWYRGCRSKATASGLTAYSSRMPSTCRWKSDRVTGSSRSPMKGARYTSLPRARAGAFFKSPPSPRVIRGSGAGKVTRPGTYRGSGAEHRLRLHRHAAPIVGSENDPPVVGEEKVCSLRQPGAGLRGIGEDRFTLAVPRGHDQVR